MNVSSWVRQIHRGLAVGFTVGVVVNVFAISGGTEPDFWVYLLALIPLGLLLATGWFLFVLPYVSR